jgi:hypothetical protein
MKDNVNPSHYNQESIEAIDAIESSMTPEQFKGYLKGNILKYCWRFEQKGGVEDLKKAQWYLNKMIEQYEQKPKEEFSVQVTPNAVFFSKL